MFEPASAGLLATETGTASVGSHRGLASRRYVYQLAEPGAAEIRFEDGRPFHRLDLSEGRASVRHDCAPDCYRGRYRVLGPDEWFVTWRVTGPHKRQLISSRLLRLAASCRPMDKLVS